MKLPVLDQNGAAAGEVDADDSVFGIEPNLGVVHQAVLYHRANRRQGTHSTLNRSDVRQANAKSRRQKGSGSARLGGPSSPTRIGGGVAHGPHPRSYRQRMPKRMRRLAIRSMLSQRAAEGLVAVADDSVEFSGRTGETAKLIEALGATRTALVISDGVDERLVRGTRNLANVSASPADSINTYALITHDLLILTQPALRKIEQLWGTDEAAAAAENGEAAAPEPEASVADGGEEPGDA